MCTESQSHLEGLTDEDFKINSAINLMLNISVLTVIFLNCSLNFNPLEALVIF